ncbi:MAG: hypothetical protein GTN81_10505 [Proteobacteria bacterium]|nr:hypothetical protein [Pseudomonadota bacterium]
MAKDISGKVILTKEEIAHIYGGGTLSVKIKGEEADASVEISCVDALPTKGTRIRFKQVDGE